MRQRNILFESSRASSPFRSNKRRMKPKTSTEHWWKDTITGKAKYSEKTNSNVTFAITNCIQTGLKYNEGLRTERQEFGPPSNSLIHIFTLSYISFNWCRAVAVVQLLIYATLWLQYNRQFKLRFGCYIIETFRHRCHQLYEHRRLHLSKPPLSYFLPFF
jgi:hypothetical protein